MAAAVSARRPRDLAFTITIPPVSHHIPAYPSSAVSPTSTSQAPTSPWKYSSQSPFADSNGYYRRTSTTITRPTMPASMNSAPTLPRHAKLHKRNDSASSTSAAHHVFTMPSPIQNEITQQHPPPARRASSHKIKPYLRKMSLRDDDMDQGRLDLSRPSAENESLAGLGIRDPIHVHARSVSDVSFLPASRRHSSHSRATSGPASLAAVAAPQPFVHPMRQMPRSFTPPAGLSHDIEMPVDEADESVGVLTSDIRQADYEFWRPRRSASTSSGPASTPLSQTYTAGSLTKLTTASQSNLSIRSQQSYEQLKSGRSRKNTDRSNEYPASPSARTSMDKAISFLSRTSVEPEDSVARAAAIRAARKAFEEKEAAKELKYEKEELKRRESMLKKEERRQKRKSENSASARLSTASNSSNDEKAVAGTEYESQFPAHDRSLPIKGEHSGASASAAPVSPPQPSKTKVAKGGWNRFLAWTRTRLLNCGGKN